MQLNELFRTNQVQPNFEISQKQGDPDTMLTAKSADDEYLNKEIEVYMRKTQTIETQNINIHTTQFEQ